MLGKRPREESDAKSSTDKGPKAVTQTPGGQPDGPEFSMELLKFYYEQLFPYNHMVAWLSYICDPDALPEESKPIPGKYMKNREICFTLKDDIYVRYRSFPTLGEFKRELKKHCPVKIDLGAIYNGEPKRKSSYTSFNAEEKELVFDIDITDYDDVRDCCSGGAVCNQCWPLMTCAIKVLEHALQKYFGLENRLWVFSGRRGIHCWVCDPGVTKYDGRIRSAIIKFLHTYTGNDRTSIKVDLAKTFNNRLPVALHSFYSESLEICMPYFRNHVLGVMDLWFKDRPAPEKPKTPGGPEKNVASYRDTMFMMLRLPLDDIKTFHTELNQMIDKGKITNSVQLWDNICEGLGKWQRGMKGKGRIKLNDGTEIERADAQLRRLVEFNKAEIVFAHIFPRVDVEVTKGVNHLLKAPFCVHPKTGKLCVPMDVNRIDEFDPTKQPTLRSLHEEVLVTGKMDGTAVEGAKKTFEKFLYGLKDAYERLPDMQAYLDGNVPAKVSAGGGGATAMQVEA